MYKNQYFELDIFEEPRWIRGQHILEIELTEENEEVELPPFITVDEDVTGHGEWSNRQIARFQ